MQIWDCCKYTRTLYTIYTHLKFKSDDNSSHIFHQWSFQYFSIHILYTQHKFFSFFFFWFYFIIYTVLQYYINSVFSAFHPFCRINLRSVLTPIHIAINHVQIFTNQRSPWSPSLSNALPWLFGSNAHICLKVFFKLQPCIVCSLVFMHINLFVFGLIV